MKVILSVALAILFSLGSCTYSISDFEGPPFSVKPDSGMYSLDSLGFDDVTNGNQILAYGDFNNDKFTDIVSMADDSQTLTIFLYSHKSFSFSSFTSFSVGKTIASVIPGDFNYDGLLDLLVITLSSDKTQTNLEYFFRTQAEPFFGPLPGQPDLTYTLQGQTQPFVLDTNGDRKPDLLFMEDGVRTVQTLLNAELDQHDFSEDISSDPACLDSSKIINNVFITPHSNAFVDFNGDCAADLFITSLDPSSNNIVFEIWLRNPSDSKFCLVDAVTMQYSGLSPVSIGDTNNDGRLDLIFASIPSDPTQPMNLHVLYNIAPGDPSYPCGSTQPPMPMVSPFSSQSYNSLQSSPNVNQVSPILLGQYSNSSRLFSPDPINRPSKFRVGDINIDGFADLLFVIQDPTLSTTSYGSIILAINENSVFNFNQTVTDSEILVYYTLLDDKPTSTTGDQKLNSIPALFASFFDFDELGKLGLWIVTWNSNSQPTTLAAGFNFVSSENFILKTLGLNGVQPDPDDITQSLGGLYYGASIECTITDIDGTPTLSKAAQMPQSAYTPLDLPYMFIGLGRTNNYIENFVMGISTKDGSDDSQQTLWTPIIPNSQLIVNPLINEDWTLDVYVNPTAETLLVVLTTLVILIILGGLIIYLHIKEKKEDEKAQDKMIHIFG